MKQLIILIIFIYFIRFSKSNLNTENDLISIESLNCSQYTNDYEVLDALPFKTLINPPVIHFGKTYALAYSNKTVFQIDIANEKFIPSILFCLQSLKWIFITNSRFCQKQSSICQLPSEIDRLATSLESLSIIGTKITHLPASFGKLKSLRKLDLGNNSLITLPNSFSNLSSLIELSLSYNKFKSLPIVIGKVNSLTNLDLYDNYNLRSIQSINGLQNLSKIYISNCPINRIPLNLPNLCLLSMSNTSLTNLNGIQTLGTARSCVQVFSFDKNQIRIIPNEIANIKDLGGFGISNNTLTNLPSEIYNIKSLDYLNIRNNRFSPNQLKKIVAKFKITNPTLLLNY